MHGQKPAGLKTHTDRYLEMGIFKITNDVTLAKARMAMEFKNGGDFLCYELALSTMFGLASNAVRDGNAALVIGHEMARNKDCEYHLEENPPYVLVRFRCMTSSMDKRKCKRCSAAKICKN